MAIPDTIKKKMDTVMKLRKRAAIIEQEIMDWFEKKGFDTQSDHFTRVIDKLSNYDATPEQIEEIIDDIREGIYR